MHFVVVGNLFVAAGNIGRLTCKKVKYLACLQLVIISQSFHDSLITAMLPCSRNQVVRLRFAVDRIHNIRIEKY